MACLSQDDMKDGLNKKVDRCTEPCSQSPSHSKVYHPGHRNALAVQDFWYYIVVLIVLQDEEKSQL
eukprot:123644-Pelagomonas_calceolata.AAC.1